MNNLSDAFADILFAQRFGVGAKSLRERHTQKQNRPVSEAKAEAGLRPSQT
jgi:hypothetical protein